MAAPSGIVWGSAVGSYGRIGIYKSLSSTATTTTVTVEVWFWSKYSVSDSNNTFYFDNLSASGSASTSKGSVSVSTTVASGSGWSTSNQIKLASYSYSYTRGTSAVTRYLYAKLTGIDRVGGTMYASTTFSVPALASYTVTYNANGGSGAPSSQVKWYNKSITLSSTKPTRSGYTFKGWATSSSSTTVAYAAGASYTANASVTLYAVWQSQSYTVTYNANGGTGAPSSQTKTQGVTLTLSSTKPTRTDYTFKGWGLTASSGAATYQAGGSYTANASITLYAVWEYSYKIPRITNLDISRCDSSGTVTDDGTYAKISFNWATDHDVTSLLIYYKETTESSYSNTITRYPSGTSGTVSHVTANTLSTESSYDFQIVIADDTGDFTATGFLNSLELVIDIKAGGTGIAFGKTAETDNLADFGFDAIFRGNVQGNAVGLSKLETVPESDDFNNYIETGCFAVNSNAAAETISNMPIQKAGRLIIKNATGTDSETAAGYMYYLQRFEPYSVRYPVYERELVKAGTDAAWTFYDWEARTYLQRHLTAGIDFNNITEVGVYTLLTATDDVGSYSNCPITSGTGTLEVMKSGNQGQIMQRLTTCSTNTEIWERFYYSSTWQPWKKVYSYGKVLWSGGYYMSASHTITLSEAISEQTNGIVLVFSAYADSAAQDYNFNSFFVPKTLVAQEPGCGHHFTMASSNFGNMASKYLYINDASISGHANNQATGTGSCGITYTNNAYVLRYVIGV